MFWSSDSSRLMFDWNINGTVSLDQWYIALTLMIVSLHQWYSVVTLMVQCRYTNGTVSLYQWYSVVTVMVVSLHQWYSVVTPMVQCHRWLHMGLDVLVVLLYY